MECNAAYNDINKTKLFELEASLFINLSLYLMTAFNMLNFDRILDSSKLLTNTHSNFTGNYFFWVMASLFAVFTSFTLPLLIVIAAIFFYRKLK